MDGGGAGWLPRKARVQRLAELHIVPNLLEAQATAEGFRPLAGSSRSVAMFGS
jgi:hypothetical protein